MRAALKDQTFSKWGATPRIMEKVHVMAGDSFGVNLSALCVDAKVSGGRGASLSPLIMTSNLLSPRQDSYSRLLAQELFKGAGARSPFNTFQSWSKTNSILGKKRSANELVKNQINKKLK